MANVVGVDIGATGVRAVEVSGSASAPAVRRAAAVKLYPGVVAGGAVEDVPALALALKELWKVGKFSTRNVALVLGGHPKVITREAEVLWTDNASDFKGLVAVEARNALPVDVESVFFDHHVLSIYDSPTRDNPNRRLAHVAIVGADQQIVNDFVAAAHKADLLPQSVDVAPFALARLISTAASGPGHLDVIIHVGADTVLLVVTLDGQPRGVHTLNDHSGRRATRFLQETFNLSIEQAEKVKVSASRDLDLGVDSPEADALNQFVAALAGAVRSTLKIACSEFQLPLGRVWLSGGGAKLGGLSARLGAELGIPTTILDPRTWTTRPARLARAVEETGQDFTLALAVGGN